MHLKSRDGSSPKRAKRAKRANPANHRTRGVRPRTLFIQVVAVVLALVGASFVFLRRGDADAAPGKAPSSATASRVDASSDPSAGSATRDLADAGVSDAGNPQDAANTQDAESPLDRAVAPDGGVPFHPQGTKYRSPFAKPDAGAPVRAKVALKLNSIDEYDVKTGIYSADFFLSFTSAQPMPAMNLVFPNGQVDNKEVLADKPTFKLFRMTGKFKSPPDLRKYPFDSQKLTILIEDDQNGIDQIRFAADKERTDLGRGFRILGWAVQYVEARSFSHSYDRFEGDDLYYNRYVFELGVERYGTSAAFKVFVPAFVIVIISLLGIWVPPHEMEVRSNAGAPMLAAAVLFHFSLMQELPATSYLTRADKLMLGVYVSLLLGMISTWAMFLVDEDKITKVFRLARWIVPIGSVVVMAVAVLS
jgi:hypothetical protein